MATITVTLPEGTTACDGKQVTFRAPCNCTGVTGIIIGSSTYELIDAVGSSVGDIGGAFSSGSMVSVILDTENSRAYIQNSASADLTNLDINATATELSYCEGLTGNIQTQLDGKSEDDHTHPASDIVSGTLAVEVGGTGYSSIADTTYTTIRYRGSSLNSTETNPTVNGAISWTYE